MKSIVWLIQENLRTLNLYAVNNNLTFPVNWRYFFFLLIQEDCLAALKVCSPIFGTRTAYRETFSQIHLPTLRHLAWEHSTHLMKQLRGEFLRNKVRDNPWVEWVIRTETLFLHRDFHEVRQPEIHSTLWRGEISRIMEQTNKDFRSRSFILTSSLLHKRFPCSKISFKTEVCSCSNFTTEAMLWIKVVEMAKSVED